MFIFFTFINFFSKLFLIHSVYLHSFNNALIISSFGLIFNFNTGSAIFAGSLFFSKVKSVPLCSSHISKLFDFFLILWFLLAQLLWKTLPHTLRIITPFVFYRWHFNGIFEATSSVIKNVIHILNNIGSLLKNWII